MKKGKRKKLKIMQSKFKKKERRKERNMEGR